MLQPKLWRKSLKTGVLFTLAFTLLAAIFTWPLVLHLRSYIFGFPGDPFAALWRIWWWGYAHLNKLNLFISPLLPVNSAVSVSIDSPLTITWQTILSLILGDVATYNFLTLLPFVASGLTMSLLGYYLTKSRVSSFVCGVFYTFSLYHIWQASSHFTLAEIEWFPLLLLSLFYLKDKRNILAALFASLSFAFTFFSQYYYGFFGALFAAGFFVIDSGITIVSSAKQNRLREAKKIFLSYALFSVFSSAMIAPISLGIIKSSLHPPKDGPITFEHNFEETLAYAARPQDYLIPSPLHPLFGKYVTPLYAWIEKTGGDYEFKSGGYPEQVVYLGLVPLSLATFAVYKSFKEKANRRVVLTLTILAIWMFLVSLPGQLSYRNFFINLPAFYLYKIAPMFRVYARAGVFVGLCVYALAGIGMGQIKKSKIKDQKDNQKLKISLFSITIVLLYAFETLNGRPNLMNVAKVPKVYQWLTEQKGDITIAEYPQDNSESDLSGGCPDWLDPKITRNFNQSISRLYQRIHQKKVVEIQELSSKERISAGDLSTKKAYKVLKKYNVDYVIWHTTDLFPKKNPLDECQERRYGAAPTETYPKIAKLRVFEDGVIYQIT